MKIIITGSTGMIGSLVLTHGLNAPQITEILSLVRKPTGQKHAKLKEIVVGDFEDYSKDNDLFKDIKVAFFCLGAYTGQVSDELFKKITVNYAVEFAKALEKNSPGATLCLLSGAGADRTEKSKTSFARYKGMAENQISSLNLRFYSLRPAYIYPVQQRKEPNFGYRLLRVLYPLLKAFGKRYSITSVELADAMFHAGLNGADQEILENQDLLRYHSEET
ncbi:NAD-dependent epimerase/dehydratase family protein [Ulvibacterium sp.]|uniref:NAD(P)H-binding protein n=1 Tax=Ulvibacterium sp. TaxID=2665914 RepID=UPI0026291DFF|nr:NAD-dependent epimerase/dehydratase family protein [Ulvibacterium sp.]